MKKISLHRLLPAVLCAAPSIPTSEPQDAARLLAEQRAGLGTPAALAALGTVVSRGKLVFEGFPNVGTFTEILAPNGAARAEALFEGIPPSVRCTNGELFWMTGTGGVEIKQGWSAAADARMFALGRHRDWRELYSRAEYVGQASVAGRACHELVLVPKSPAELGIAAVPGEEAPAPDTWWLDRDTQELVRVAIYATVSGAGWQRLLLDSSDWRTVGGVRFPFKSRMSFGPTDHALVIDLTRESLEVDVELDTDPFQPDEEVFQALARAGSGETGRTPRFAVQQQSEMLTATVRVKCKPTEIQQQLAVILPEVMGYLTREQLAPVGPPFARYHSFGAEVDLEAGIPVAKEIAGGGRVQPSSLPGGEVASGMHVGPYEELERTHAELARWLAQSNLAAQGGPWEVYWTDPGLERDPSKWRTEVFQPIAARAASGATAGRDAALERFDILVGTWEVTGGPGGVAGRVSFEWLDGQHFLVQRFDLTHGPQVMKGLEIIGRERLFGATEASVDIKSRVYDNMGNTLDYVWEVGDGTLTIWGGERGSPMAYRGVFSPDGNTVTGGWTWPGGGLETTMTRVAEPRPAAQRRP
jgi:effector-binding domain-containing protein